MTSPDDYKLINIRNRELKLRAQHQKILSADSQKALDLILDAPAPATLIQSFPDQDLYYLMHKIGPDDFIPVLAMATSQQWEYIMDVEIWDSDQIDLPAMTNVLDILFQADPGRLLRWGIKEKPALFEYYLSRQMSVTVREHDDPPPSDHDDYITIDDKFYYRFPDREDTSDGQTPIPEKGTPAWELIEQMLKLTADMDLSVFHGLLLETQCVLPVEVEEEEFRLKNLRLAEKGFLPAHEAIGIYQPAKLDTLRKRPKAKTDRIFLDPDIPLPPQFFNTVPESADLFVAALSFFEPDVLIELESEMGALINKVISADKIKLRSRSDLETATRKTRAYINLGLEMILENDIRPENAVHVIQTYFLEDIFRTASRACLLLRTKAINWFSNSTMNAWNLPLSFLDETYLGLLGGLMLERPRCYDPLAKGDFYRDFNTFKDIEQSRVLLDQIIALDTVLGKIDVDLTSFTYGVLSYKTFLLTLWAKDRIGLEKNLAPIPLKQFKPFFRQLFERDDNKEAAQLPLDDLTLWICEQTQMAQPEIPGPFLQVIRQLIRELNEEYGQVAVQHIDPRFISHFLLRSDKK